MKYNRTNRTDRLNKYSQDLRNWTDVRVYERAVRFGLKKSKEHM